MLSIVRNWMMKKGNILCMIKNSMLLYKPWRSGDIIWFLRNLCCILITKLYSIWDVNITWIRGIWNGLSIYNFLHLWLSIKVELLTKLQMYWAKDVLCWHRWRFRFLDFRRWRICMIVTLIFLRCGESAEHLVW